MWNPFVNTIRKLCEFYFKRYFSKKNADFNLGKGVPAPFPFKKLS